MPQDPKTDLAALTADAVAAEIEGLAILLHACVLNGASVNFVLPFSLEESRAFWTGKVLPRLHDGRRIVFAARQEGRIVGTVQLDYDTPPNQPHRAEVTKLLVHPDCRRHGIARALIGALERQAQALGRTLITLDTATGHPSESFYRSLGYQAAGVIPDYCRDPVEDRLISTTILYKHL